MTIFSALIVAFAAFGIWLTVRVVNRRENWAKRSLAVLAALPVLYVLSFGPACWISSRINLGEEFGLRILPKFYEPIVSRMWPQSRFSDVANWYAQLGAAASWSWHMHMEIPNSSTFQMSISAEFGWGLERNDPVSFIFESSTVTESSDVQLMPGSGFVSPD